MRFTCSFVTSIFLGLMSVVGLLLVVLQSSSSDIQLGPTHPRTCLPLPCPPRRGASSPRKPYSYAWPKGRHHRRGHHRNSHTVATTDTTSTPGTGNESTKLEIARSQMLNDSGGLPMTSRSIQLHDVTTPLAARPPAAVCHPDAHDAIDTWVGQLEVILGELALRAQKGYTSREALIGEGLHKIAAGISHGITG
ncbi:unnamed protein product, partial [Ectocarpus sp. 6 AP-2014]